MSALYYGVNILKIKRIIICGHYNCGGIISAISSHQSYDILDKWLSTVFNISKKYENLIKNNYFNEKINILSKLNIIEQTINIAKTNIIQNAWQKKIFNQNTRHDI